MLEEIACVTLNCTQIAMSVFATKNEDRFELTYREFANVSNVRLRNAPSSCREAQRTEGVGPFDGILSYL